MGRWSNRFKAEPRWLELLDGYCPMSNGPVGKDSLPEAWQWTGNREILQLCRRISISIKTDNSLAGSSDGEERWFQVGSR